MTIIAYRDGVIAADTQVLDGDIRMGRVRKITRSTKDGTLAGAAGPASNCEEFLSWVRMGRKCDTNDYKKAFEKDEDCPFLGMVFLEEDHTVAYIYDYTLVPIIVEAPFFAIGGAGAAVALGAFEMGATAEQAVRAAIKYDSGCGGEVEVLCQ